MESAKANNETAYIIPPDENMIKVYDGNDAGILIFSQSETVKLGISASNDGFMDFGNQDTYRDIIEFIRKKGFACSSFTSYFVLHGLGRAKEYELIFKLMTNTSTNSWYQMLREGATCVLEGWSKTTKNSFSMCHAWSSAPVSVIGEYPEVLNIK